MSFADILYNWRKWDCWQIHCIVLVHLNCRQIHAFSKHMWHFKALLFIIHGESTISIFRSNTFIKSHSTVHSVHKKSTTTKRSTWRKCHFVEEGTLFFLEMFLLRVLLHILSFATNEEFTAFLSYCQRRTNIDKRRFFSCYAWSIKIVSQVSISFELYLISSNRKRPSDLSV